MTISEMLNCWIANNKGRRSNVNVVIFCITLITAIINLPVSGQAIEDSECLECHDSKKINDMGTYDEVLNLSSHAGSSCTDCHSDITELPHNDSLGKVECGDCHDAAAQIYRFHGRKSVTQDEDIPRCADCHGEHHILPATDKSSMTNPLNLPATCGRCHENIDLTKRHEILYGKAVEVYKSSVHGKATLGGVYTAATCNDCHSSDGTAHKILGPGNSESTINHFNIPKTCGKCHRNIENDYWEGIHGKLVERGETDAPVCTDCHGEHGIIAASDPQSRVSPSRVAEATCAPCHESARLNEKYGTPTERLKTWVDSYHGLKSKAGDLTVANCASCHGAHRILPHTDSTSSIFSGNLQATCGECHPGISQAMAATPIHGIPGVSGTPAANIVKYIYLIAIFIIIGLMVIHWLLDLLRKIKDSSRGRQIERMKIGEVWQHTFLMVSFIVLVITGFALRYSESWWVDFFFGWEGGFPLRGVIHRFAAVVFIITVIWHIIYLTTNRGRRFLGDMKPKTRDFTDFLWMSIYNLGLRKGRPTFSRFSYVEKAEYWALVWGTVIMIFSGFFLWFDNFAVKWFPKGFLDVMVVVHYYEALLATLAILIWHLYSTIFDPNVYPMNPSWYSGKMPAEMYKNEHPADPIIAEKKNESSFDSGDGTTNK
jgi:cytochrome b subunit of formate dehydrogenase